MADTQTAVEIAKYLTLTVVLILVIAGFVKGLIVPGWLYTAKCQEVTEYRNTLFEILKVPDSGNGRKV